MGMNVLLSLIILIVLLFTGIPVFMAMSIAGLVGIYPLFGSSSLIIASKVFFDTPNNFILLAIPLFILMGVILAKGGIGEKLYAVFDSFLRHIPGGVGMATILTCAVLAAMCGTSVAIAAMVGAFAFTNLKKYGYSLPLSLGIVAAGGALGILIPPSVPMIVYSAFSEESTGKLFLAGVIPGIITVILFCLYVGWAYRKQGGNKVAKPASWSERWQSLKNGIWALLIPVGIMIPLYAGWATPTETAALGTLWALIVGIFIYRTISWKDVIPLLKEGLSSSVMIMIIICGAMVLGNAVTQIGLSQAMANLFANNLSPLMFIASTILIMLFMGCFLEGASIMMICLPIFITTLRVYNLNLIWYAVIMVMSIEIGLLTPPVGLNIYAIDGVAKQLGLPSTLGIAVKGSYMFMLLYLISMILVVLIPQLALWIPLGM